MSSIKEYFSSVGTAVKSLLTGMGVTGKEFVTPKITECYPENRDQQLTSDRFRAELTLKYDAEGHHKCIGCGICQMNCPNGTIKLQTKMVELPDGKKKRVLDKYMYDLGSCTFCMLCVTSCPQNALEFSNDFEQAVFTRDKLVKQLNYLPEPDYPAAAPAPAKPKFTPEELEALKAKAAAARAAKAAAAAGQASKAGDAVKAALAAPKADSAKAAAAADTTKETKDKPKA